MDKLLTEEEIFYILSITQIDIVVNPLLNLPLYRCHKIKQTIEQRIFLVNKDMPMCGHIECMADWLKKMEDLYHMKDSIIAITGTHLN